MTTTTYAAPATDLVTRIKGEYQEMPGLRLTIRQAGRLFGMDHHMCERVLTHLVERRFLRVTRDGHFVQWADSPVH